MNTRDSSHLFQSDASLKQGRTRALKAERTAYGAAYGSPIWLGMNTHFSLDAEKDAIEQPKTDVVAAAKRAASAQGGTHKVIDACMSGPWESCVWTAESDGVARCTSLETGEQQQLLSGHGGPVSAVTLLPLRRGRTIVCTASWDQCIRVWPAMPGAKPACLVKLDHAAGDLLKALHMDAASRIMYSGGSDKVVRAWDMSALAQWVEGLADDAWNALATQPAANCPVPHVISALHGAHTRPVICIATLPPKPSEEAAAHDVPRPGTLFTADSMGRVLQVAMDRDGTCIVERELNGHETSVHAIVPVWREASGDVSASLHDVWLADVWTASSDETVRRFCLSASAGGSGKIGARTSAAGAVQGTQLPIYAAEMIHVPGKAHTVLPLHNIPDIESGSVLVGTDDGTLQVYTPAPGTKLEGHWLSVTFAGVWLRNSKDTYVVTASLDGTVRRWSMAALRGEKAEPPAPRPGAQMTEEEEAELEALLDD